MIATLLQINTNRSAAAMDLAMATAAKYETEYICVSEPNIATIQKSSSRWYVDNKKDAAIGYVGPRSRIMATEASNGYVWVLIDGVIHGGGTKPTVPGYKKGTKAKINKRKGECWIELVNDVESDYFGKGCKIVTRTVKIRHPPIVMPSEEKTEWVEKLFPPAEEMLWTKGRRAI